uniref:Zinc finger protein 366 n=2 Tax=Leptobrachium leishanense TaxID=445787 RepID=A0A8C5LH55_9ANUR
MQEMLNQRHMMQKDISCFEPDVKKPVLYTHFGQAMPSIFSYNRLAPFDKEYKSHLSHYRYNVPSHNSESFNEEIEGGSQKTKTFATKTSHCGSEAPNIKPHLSVMNEDENLLSSSLPLMYHLSPFSSYSSKMFDLSNDGIQYYRTVDQLWNNSIKEEHLRANVMWPAGSFYFHPSYSYCPKVYPEMMFPFHMSSQSIKMSNAFGIRRPKNSIAIRTPNDELEDPKQKVERVDVNIQIDDSFYVDVGDQKRWKCAMCDKSYTSKYNLVTHILGHNGIKPHACTRCGKLFKQLSHLHTHMLMHQGTRPHKCHVCQKAFTQTSHLKRHMMQHSEVKPYTCTICGRGFAYPSELKVHEAKHENGQENVCVECGLDFPTLAQLKRHLTAHRGPVQYNCSECDKTFQYPSQLQNHMMKHKDIRPHICSECGMEFVQPHHLKQHALTHKGVKEHKCGICGREFTLLANMKRHVLIHTNIRAYQCHLCFKSFVQKQTLKAHMIVHSDIKPFKCKLCGKEFNRMHNLLGHMHLHTDSKPFKCMYCPSKFTLKGNLTRHMKVKHGVMERGYHSRGLGRGRTGLSHSIVLRSMEQKEPFDLSNKRKLKGAPSQSDGESVKGNSSQDEEDQGAYKHDMQYVKQHQVNRSVLREPCRGEKEGQMYGDGDEDGTHTCHKEEVEDKNLSLREGNFGQTVPDYLCLKNRNTTLKELIKKKMKWTNEKLTTKADI